VSAVSTKPARKTICGTYGRSNVTTAASAPDTYCRRCCRVYGARARELEMVHTCPACMARQEALRSA
jgi:hypothetical protein